MKAFWLVKKIVLIFSVSVLFFSCATTGKTAARETGDFFEENNHDFTEHTLSNGIPVVLKHIPSEKNIELRLLFDGGASTSPKNKSGLDLLTFELLSSAPAVKELVSHGQYFAVNACANDFSTYGFSSANTNFFEALEIFAESILNPSYTHEDYLRLESAAAAGALDRNENMRFAMLNSISENLYKSHPYYEGIYYKSASRVSEYDIQQNLSALLNAKRMKIIVAGNFAILEGNSKRGSGKDSALLEATASTISEIKNRLEEFFGAVPESEFAAPKIPAINLANKNDANVSFEFAGNSYCAALCFRCPSRGVQDYEAFALSTLALDYVLRRDVVEKEKAASSCGVAVLNGKESLALIVATGENGEHDIKQTINAALQAFPTEEALLPLLDMFKNIYATKIYSSAQDEYATLEQIASSIYYEGKPDAYLKRIEKIQTITAAEVVAAFKKYFLSDENFFVEISSGNGQQ